MDASSVAQFWLVAVLLALTPGADWAYAIAAVLRGRSVVPSVLGMVFGYVVVVSVVAVGVGALVTKYPLVLTVLTFAGAAYLVYLGVSTLRSKVEHLTASDRPVGDHPVAQFFRGAGISGINPKGLLLLLALLPQFTSPSAGWSSAAQMFVLGGLHILNCAVVYFGVALMARRMLRSRPRASVIVTRIAGVVMTVIGIVVIVEKALTL
ncbi:LysE family translocator [Cellulosimicrobium funkei]|uniref:LysE family translocator n=1 Tax=Cellulosimicrobium funkei TaxID=264251 RepID=UPI000885B51B|nr:Threonine/homoserine/homoserine lactone efflux protein [Cellulosimicrobium cellulans]